MPQALIQRLVEQFMKFPGIGPRQARRFVQYLLGESDAAVESFTADLHALRAKVGRCELCFRFFLRPNGDPAPRCEICRNPERDPAQLMVVEKDVDLEAVERAHVYTGLYFVLGGLAPAVEKNLEKHLRLTELKERLGSEIAEVILALAANPEGDRTTHLLRLQLEPIAVANNIKIAALGRGLSTGTELEYSDTDTLKNALKNRS